VSRHIERPHPSDVCVQQQQSTAAARRGAHTSHKHAGAAARARSKGSFYKCARPARSVFSIHSTQFTFGGLFLSLHAPHYTLEPMCPRLYGAIARASQNKHPTMQPQAQNSRIRHTSLAWDMHNYICASGQSVHLNHAAVWIIAHAKSRGGPKRDACGAPLCHLTLILHSRPFHNYNSRSFILL